ncbi:SWI/SNF and RSC complex subunit Ssr2 [Sorochytrium milnesiophthora]
MVSLQLVFCAFALAVLAVAAEPVLVVQKSFKNEHTVKGRQTSIITNIYNIGSSSAFDVTYTDDSLQPSDFSIVSGKTSFASDELAPAANVTNEVVVVPLIAGKYKDVPGVYTYRETPDGDIKRGQSSTYGTIPILTEREFSAFELGGKIRWFGALLLGGGIAYFVKQTLQSSRNKDRKKKRL